MVIDSRNASIRIEIPGLINSMFIDEYFLGLSDSIQVFLNRPNCDLCLRLRR